jgi:hypothetical protein
LLEGGDLTLLLEQIDRFSALVLVGAQGGELLKKCIESDALIVEVSAQPSLEVGRVKYLIGEPSELFPILCENLRESFY